MPAREILIGEVDSAHGLVQSRPRQLKLGKREGKEEPDEDMNDQTQLLQRLQEVQSRQQQEQQQKSKQLIY